MRSIIAKWSIKPGCDQQAIAALGELAESVKRQEPYTLTYLIHTANAEGSRPTPAANEQHSPYLPHQFGKWVSMRGGEYFFLPSRSFLTGTTT